MGVNAIALVLVASFAIDRIVNFLLFALSYNGRWDRRFPEPASVKGSAAQMAAEKKRKAVYFALAAPIGIIAFLFRSGARAKCAGRAGRSHPGCFPDRSRPDGRGRSYR
jgi:hypothetical protein